MTTTNASTSTSIHARALLVALHISTWSARKYDKGVSAQTNAAHNASGNASRVNKLLLPGEATSYKQLTALASAMRLQHYANTLAWGDNGDRLLPTANYSTYTQWLRDRQREFAAAKAQFVADYPAMWAEAPSLLGKMYRHEDYPRVSEIADRFSVTVNYGPVPAQGDLRVDLGADQVAMIETAIAAQTDRAVAGAMQDAWTRLHDVVSKIAERLAQPEAIFRDSLISNAADCCNVLQRLNVTDDPNLETMRQRVLAELTRFSPETLRDVPSRRQQTADKAQDILTAMAGMWS